MSIWVSVADSAKAKILVAEGQGLGAVLIEHHVIDHEEGRLHEREMSSDRPGRFSDRSGQARHAVSNQVNPKKQETIRFAREVANYLEEQRNAHSIERLYVVAPPAFLGLLREHFSDELNDLVVSSIDKNIVNEDSVAIRKHLPDFL